MIFIILWQIEESSNFVVIPATVVRIAVMLLVLRKRAFVTQGKFPK